MPSPLPFSPSEYYQPTPPHSQYHPATTTPSPPPPKKDRLSQWIELRQSQGRAIPKSLLARAAKAKSRRFPSTSNKENEINGRLSTPPSRTPPILPIKSFRKKEREATSAAIPKRPKPCRRDTEDTEDDPKPKSLRIEHITLPRGRRRPSRRLRHPRRDPSPTPQAPRHAWPDAGSLSPGRGGCHGVLLRRHRNRHQESARFPQGGWRPLEGNTYVQGVSSGGVLLFREGEDLEREGEDGERGWRMKRVWAEEGGGIERKRLRNHAGCAAGQRPYRDRWGKMHVR